MPFHGHELFVEVVIQVDRMDVGRRSVSSKEGVSSEKKHFVERKVKGVQAPWSGLVGKSRLAETD